MVGVRIFHHQRPFLRARIAHLAAAFSVRGAATASSRFLTSLDVFIQPVLCGLVFDCDHELRVGHAREDPFFNALGNAQYPISPLPVFRFREHDDAGFVDKQPSNEISGQVPILRNLLDREMSSGSSNMVFPSERPIHGCPFLRRPVDPAGRNAAVKGAWGVATE